MTTTGGDRHVVPACVLVAGSSLAVLPLAVRGVDPIDQPLSHYATKPAGFLLVGLACLAAAAASLRVGSALVRAGLPRARAVRVLLGGWSAALVVAAAFPTTPPGAPTDASAVIHRLAAAAVMAVPPILGWLAAARAHAAERWAAAAPRLRTWSAAAAVLGATFLCAQAPTLAGGDPYPLLGALEALLCGAIGALLLTLAGAARAATSAAVAPTAQTSDATGASAASAEAAA